MSDLVKRLRGNTKFDDLFGEAADRIEELERENAALKAERDAARKTSSYWKGELLAANNEIDALKAEVTKWKEEHHFQACLTKDLLPYQDRAVKAEAERDALKADATAENARWASMCAALKAAIDAARKA